MARPKRNPPNILIFLVDQMPYDVVAEGHPCRMPNARRLAGEGVSFTRTFTPSPHCCPSRATFSMPTGRLHPQIRRRTIEFILYEPFPWRVVQENVNGDCYNYLILQKIRRKIVIGLLTGRFHCKLGTYGCPCYSSHGLPSYEAHGKYNLDKARRILGFEPLEKWESYFRRTS